jgi:hypothetical protein
VLDIPNKLVAFSYVNTRLCVSNGQLRNLSSTKT